MARKYSNYQDGITVLYAYGKRKSGSGIIANGEVLCGASGAAGEVENIPLHTPDIESERIAFCSERLQTIIALMNPGRVVIYELDEGMDTDKLIGLIKSKMRPYLLPEFKLGAISLRTASSGLASCVRLG